MCGISPTTFAAATCSLKFWPLQDTLPEVSWRWARRRDQFGNEQSTEGTTLRDVPEDGGTEAQGRILSGTSREGAEAEGHFHQGMRLANRHVEEVEEIRERKATQGWDCDSLFPHWIQQMAKRSRPEQVSQFHVLGRGCIGRTRLWRQKRWFVGWVRTRNYIWCGVGRATAMVLRGRPLGFAFGSTVVEDWPSCSMQQYACSHGPPKRCRDMQGGSRSKAKACACCSRGMMRARDGGRSQKMTAERQSFKAIRMTPYLLCVCVS